MTTWNERFAAGEYPRDPEPSPVLEGHVAAREPGRALDLATGTGRNALFLADVGWQVDALDQSRVGLELARETARERGVDDRIDWVQADATSYAFPAGTYDLVAVSFYRAVDRFADLKEALAPDGLLYVQHHLRTTDDVDVGPGTDRYRFAANELCNACLDLTILYFDQKIETRADGATSATTEIVARNSHGTRQSYPEVAQRE
ncbi:MAG: class I SAM-dependent methyltransferase [Haloarculaceae archaeon]